MIAHWTAATSGSQEFKNKHILFESTGNILTLHKLHLFVSVCNPHFTSTKFAVTFLVIFEEDWKEAHTYTSLLFWCMKFHYYFFYTI